PDRRVTGRDEEVAGLPRADVGATVDDQVAVPVQFDVAGHEASERDQAGAVDADDLVLTRLPHVQQVEVGPAGRPVREQGGELPDADHAASGVGGLGGGHSAPGVVVDELGDGLAVGVRL